MKCGKCKDIEIEYGKTDNDFQTPSRYYWCPLLKKKVYWTVENKKCPKITSKE